MEVMEGEDRRKIGRALFSETGRKGSDFRVTGNF